LPFLSSLQYGGSDMPWERDAEGRKEKRYGRNLIVQMEDGMYAVFDVSSGLIRYSSRRLRIIVKSCIQLLNERIK
jgi:hypothetical protein